MNEIAEVISGITKNMINNILAIQEQPLVSTVGLFCLIWFHQKTDKDSQQYGQTVSFKSSGLLHLGQSL